MSRVGLVPTLVRALSFALVVIAAARSGTAATSGPAPAFPVASIEAGQKPVSTGVSERGELRPTSGWEWWRDKAVQKAIGLTPEQIEKIDRLFTAWVEEARPRMEELHRGLAELEALGLDERAFAGKLETLGALQGRLWESRILMLHRISRVATPVQRERLQELFRARSKDKDHDSRGRK